MNEDFIGTMPVTDQHRLNERSLARYLERLGPEFTGPLSMEQFKGGQSNPTYRLSIGGRHYVLRKKPGGTLLPSAHAVDREYRVITALRDSGVPVARTYCLCMDPQVIGAPFYVMEFIAGRVLWDGTLPHMSPSERAAVYDEMNRVIAALHSVDFNAVGLGDYGRPGNYFERQIARWSKQYRASETETLPDMDQLIEWLPRNIPASEQCAIVHGDYRLDNVIFHPSEPRIVAVLDWELSTLGHPLADFAYHMLPWRLRADEFRGIAHADLAALGIPSEHEYLQRYCRRAGIDAIAAADWDFYLAYNLFRLAAILQGIRKRVIDGTASSRHAVETGEKTPIVARAASRLVEGLMARR